MKRNRFPGGFLGAWYRRWLRPKKGAYRLARLEWLEPRMVLAAPVLNPIGDVTLLAGAPLNIALHASDADHDYLYFTATSSNPLVTPILLDPLENRSVRMSVNYTGAPGTADDIQGDMVFQLFEQWAPNTTARFVELIDTGGPDGTPFYDGLTFHRIIEDFMIQGGDPLGNGTGGSGVQFDDEFTAELQFTSSGILAMANSGPDTNDSQFFITDAPTRWLDFKHTIFGFLIQGDDIRQRLQAVPTDSNDKPLYRVEITSMTVEIDTENQVLHLSAPAGTTGEATITVTVWDADPDNQPVTRSFHVTIQPDTNNNDPFLGPIDPIQTTVNTPVTFQIPATDVEGDAIFYGGLTDPDVPSLSIVVDNNTGQATLTPSNNLVGVQNIAVGVRAPNGSDWDTQVVPVFIRPGAPSVSLAPESDTGSSNSDRITRLNNTADKKLRFQVSQTVNGALVELMADGVVIGSATASGDSVVIESTGSYQLSDGVHSITARQTLLDQAIDAGNLQGEIDLASDESTPVNIVVDTAAPQITSTAVTTASEGLPYAYDVQSDAEGAGASYQLTTFPTGMAIDAQTGLIAWTPSGMGGTSQPVTVRVSDLAGNFSEQSFTIQVAEANTPPVAIPQSIVVWRDTPQAIQLAGDDGDPEVVQTLVFEILTQPSHGTLGGFDPATGSVTYTPAPGYLGPDSFTFRVIDDALAGEPPNLASPSATVSIRVARVNHPPVADPQTVSTDEDTPLALNLTGNDGDPEAIQTLTFEIVQPPAHGTLIGFDAATGTVTYQPSANYSGPDSFVFRVIDQDPQGEPTSAPSEPAVVAISVNPVNDTPVANPQNVAVQSNVARQILLSGSDGDPDFAQSLTFAIASGPNHGTITGFDPVTGSFTYTPDPDYRGADSLTFTVTDDGTAGGPALTSAPATVSILVSVINLLPRANDQSVTTAEDTALAITLTGEDGNPEVVQTLTFAIIQQPSHGTLSGFNAATGEVVYTPAAGYNGPDSFTFQVTDDDSAGEPGPLVSAPATVSITVTPVNDPPTAESRTVATAQDTPRPITLLGFDGDPEVVQTLTFAIVQGPSHGTLTGFDPATGQVIYTPDAHYSGPDSFTYKVIDDGTAGGAALESVPATIGIQVAAVNSPPVAQPQSATTLEDTSLAITLLGDDGDPEVDQVLRFALVSSPRHGRLMGFDPGTGHVRYVPDPDFNGSDSFTFTVTDDNQAGEPGSRTSALAQVSIMVTPVDDPPRFAPIGSLWVLPGQWLRTSVRAVDPDAPNTPIRYSLETPAPAGMTIDPATGAIRWQVPPNLPAGMVRTAVRATELGAGGQPGLAAVQSLEIRVEDIRLALLGALIDSLASTSRSEGNSGIAETLPGRRVPETTPGATMGSGTGQREIGAPMLGAMDLGTLADLAHLGEPSPRAPLATLFASLGNAGPGALLDLRWFTGFQIGSYTGSGSQQVPKPPEESQPEADQQPPEQPARETRPPRPMGQPQGSGARPRQGEVLPGAQPALRGRAEALQPGAADLAFEGLAETDLEALAAAALTLPSEGDSYAP